MRTSWAVAMALVALGGTLLGACAQGSSGAGSGGEGGEGGEDSGQGPGPSSGSMSSSAGGMGGMGGAGGAGGGVVTSSGSGAGSGGSASSSSASGSGGGGVCGETPCKLVAPQCGCAAGEMCQVDGTGERACIPAGSVAVGGICDVDDACAAGGICLKKTASVSTCGAFCTTDAQCTAPGGLCVVKLNDGSGNDLPGVTLCSENCNATTNVGCVAGTGCVFGREAAGQMRLFTSCLEVGSGTQGASCTDNTDCAATYGCFNTGTNKCLKYCNVDAPSCPAGASCTPITIGMDQVEVIIGSVKYGACL